MTLKNNRAPLLSNIKLYASFHHHMWIQTGVTVRKRLSWVLTSVTLTFDLWPWPFAWTLLWSLVITPENFMMIRWWEHSQKGVTDRRTDGQTENTICRAAWSQLTKMYIASARAQFKINSHGCWNWHLCIPDGLSVVQCSLGHVIGIVFFDTISVAWSDCAGQLAAGGVASVWRMWVQSLPGPQ